MPDAEQRSPDWLLERQGCITASRFADVLTTGRSKDQPWGKTALSYAYEVVAGQLLKENGELMPEVYSTAIGHGVDNEPDAIELYEQQTGQIVDPTGYIPMTDMIGGSPDGLVGDDGLIEVKCPYSPARHVMTADTGTVPDEYLPQIQGYMMITGRLWCDFVSYDPRMPERSRLCVIRVERDEVYIGALLDRLTAFTELVNGIRDRVEGGGIKQ